MELKETCTKVSIMFVSLSYANHSTKNIGMENLLISYNNDQKVIDAFPNFGVDEVDWTYGMKNVSDENMGESSEILLYSQQVIFLPAIFLPATTKNRNNTGKNNPLAWLIHI